MKCYQCVSTYRYIALEGKKYLNIGPCSEKHLIFINVRQPKKKKTWKSHSFLTCHLGIAVKWMVHGPKKFFDC